MKKKLPIYGVGPVYVLSCLLLSLAGIIFDYNNLIASFEIISNTLILFILGGLIIVFGVSLWVYAVIIQKIDKEIKQDNLITTGVYSIVRNPIYSAFLFVFTGVLIWMNNLYLLILPLVFYIFLTILMIYTEEKWLKEKFGNEYIAYCSKVNRVIPWFNKKQL